MRAPLRAIYSFTNATLEEYGENIGANGRQFLSRVINSARRMDNLIQDVLNFSRISRHEVLMRPVHLEKLIPDIIYDRPELQPPNAEIEIASPLLPMLGDRVSLTQCLANLLGNAVKFVAPGVKPRVKIWTELRHDKTAGPRGAPFPDQSGHSGHDAGSVAGNGQPHVRLWVEDNGIGIRAESQRKVFGLFQRVHIGANYEGTGLGLAIVRKAVERMGGEAGVQSEFGSGSQFWIQLPLGEGEEPSHDLSATESSTEHDGVGDEAQLKPA